MMPTVLIFLLLLLAAECVSFLTVGVFKSKVSVSEKYLRLDIPVGRSMTMKTFEIQFENIIEIEQISSMSFLKIVTSMHSNYLGNKSGSCTRVQFAKKLDYFDNDTLYLSAFSNDAIRACINKGIVVKGLNVNAL